ncbi:putative membrane protein [Campylobacter blaseri]|uniref:Uncharacterized protein n=1 Tax=Campylobacter blaseri TaxID=2042961 RepID=A0A2P8R2D6_9BACT|nr:hypothetical protein [Campylobacter blaseri]PSM52660.1 hypothetical protein CQ405_02705 [Campylobacter blaseri]PSM54308.1 hypothetical protein CRN67_02705 [Campylobacter blaseri]QKF85959.1 putative membrane protein [Campylobacter blaseri]
MEIINHFFIAYMQYLYEPLYGFIYSFISSFDLTFNQRKFITFGILFLVPILLLEIKFIHKIIISFGLSAICIAIYEIAKVKDYLDTELPTKIASYIFLLLIALIFIQAIKKLFK